MPLLLSSQNVFEYLIAQGICTQSQQSESEIELKPAKNFNLLLSLPSGSQLLIKQEPYNREGKTTGEFLREWQMHEFLQRFPETNKIHPYISEALHFDAENSIIVFNYLKNYRDLADFYSQENLFSTKIATVVGTTLASLHRISWNRQECRDFWQNYQGASTQRTPDLTFGLERITPEVFSWVPIDGLKFFALYQRYDSLGKAIANLSQSYTPCCLTHNDLKLNNILLCHNWEDMDGDESSQGIIRLIDWERAAWGDPTSDLGALISSYLQIWLGSMITSKAIALEESLRLATTPLEVLQPSIAALAIAYLANFPEILEHRPDFLLRVVQFAGLGLIEAIQARLEHEKTFGNSGICMLQVAKSLLCRPEKSVSTVFGMAALELTHQGSVSRLK
ncbi:MAG: phosphotransferase [Nostocaceae cyanobacterium]|nr:phosphotransferase [Nostocaceae cyanobacterium]